MRKPDRAIITTHSTPDRRPTRPPETPTLTVAFLGLGAMGAPMATRLVESGFKVRAYNRSRGPERAVEQAGAWVWRSPRVAATGADIVITMVSDARALHAVLDGEKGVLAAFAAEKRSPRPILLDMSTIGRAAALSVARKVRAHGGTFVDAPVSGSVGPARSGQLLTLVGGNARAIKRVRPILSAMCRAILVAGPVGQGQALKVVLNGIGAHHFVAFTSMLALGERAGLSREVLIEAFTTGAFTTPSYVGKRDKVLSRNYAPDFSLALALKDCLLNAALQEEVGLSLGVHQAIVRDVSEGIASGHGDRDLYGLEQHYGRRA